MVTNQDEYKTPNGETISIQFDEARNNWEVANWDKDDQNRWLLNFDNEAAARSEYERWRR